VKPCRIHIVGASSSGTTSLGHALALHLSIPHFDTDDFYWKPSTPEFTEKRDTPKRLDLMEQLFLPRGAWVLSGSLAGWGDPVIPYFDLVIFLQLAHNHRIARIKARELARYGSEALAKGGNRHDHYQAFMQWVASYDDPSFSGRSFIRHQAWLEKLNCPVIKLNSEITTQQMLTEIIKL